MLKNFLVFISCFFFITSCSYRPILDQNAQFFLTSEEQKNQEIDKCMKDGDEYVKQFKARRAAKQAARKAVIGAVIGSAVGLIFGNNLKSIATGAAIGTGVGAASGALGVAGEGKVTPDQIKQRYVANCLARQGYQVIGWE